ncbi:MAG: substrate-binding domain-containing protein [Anaerolineales bacterium]|nr:MAG: substrate-binding domain-containing protein [Anaerolineales bacterium]
MRKQNAKIALAFLVIPLLAITGCTPAGASVQSQQGLTGTITVSGAWALYPMMVRWAEEFQELHPGVKFDISAGGAGKGMADALAGAVDIGMVSRIIYPEEIEKGAFWVSVTKDAVFPTFSEKNPVADDLRQQGITREKLIGIYITGEITNWGQVVDRPQMTDPIHIFTRSDAAGAPATWADYLGNRKQEDLLGVGVYGDPGVLQAVIKDPLAIGFNNLNYAFDFQTSRPVAGARVMPIDLNGNGQADPEEVYDTKEQAVTAVAKGYYPSPPARDLNLVTQGKPQGLTEAFIEWVLTDGQQYLDEVGYIPLAAEQLQEGLQKLD